MNFDIETVEKVTNWYRYKAEQEANKGNEKIMKEVNKLKAEIPNMKTEKAKQSRIDKVDELLNLVDKPLDNNSVLEKAALSPHTGRIVCIVASKMHNGNMIQFLAPKENDEREMLLDFFDFAEGAKSFAGTNIREFDLPFILGRAAHLGIYKRALSVMPRKKYDNKVLDYMEVFGGSSGRIRQQEICKMLGIEVQDGMFIKGSQVDEYFKAGKLGDIAKHCQADVYQCKMIAYRMGLMTKESAIKGKPVFEPIHKKEDGLLADSVDTSEEDAAELFNTSGPEKEDTENNTGTVAKTGLL